MIKALFKHIYKYYKDTFILAIAGVVIGVLVGIIDAAFGLGLNACTAIRTKYFWYLIWFLPLGGVFIWFIYHQFGKSVANGMKMVFHVGLGKNNKLPIRMVPLAVIGTWTTHLFGGSAGREGVAVQIGAAVSNNVGRLVDKTIDIENSRKMFLITGMAAGFSGLFCTPPATWYSPWLCNLFCTGGIGCRKAGISCFDSSNSSFHQCSFYITGARTSEISY